MANYIHFILCAALTFTSAQVYVDKFACSFNTAVLAPSSWCFFVQSADDVFNWNIAYDKPFTSSAGGPHKDYTQFVMESEPVREQSFILPDLSSKPRVSGENAVLLTPLFFAGTYNLSFAYHASGTRPGVLRVQYHDEPPGYGEIKYLDDTTLLWYYASERNVSESTWKIAEKRFISKENFQILFEFITDHIQDGILAIDHINVTQISTDIGSQTATTKFHIPSFCSFELGGAAEPDCIMNCGNNWFITPLNQYKLPDHSKGTLDGYVLLLLTHEKEISFVSSSKEFFPHNGCLNIKFYYHTPPYPDIELDLYLSTSSKPIWTLKPTAIFGWNEVNLENLLIRKPTRLIFRGSAGEIERSFIMIDDLSIESCPYEVGFTECSFTTSMCDFHSRTVDFFRGWYLQTDNTRPGPFANKIQSYLTFRSHVPMTAASRGQNNYEAARLFSTLMSAGKYKLEFLFHPSFENTAGLGVFRVLQQTEGDNSGELLFYLSGAHNGSIARMWKHNALRVNSEKPFRIIFEAIIRNSHWSQFSLSQVKLEQKDYTTSESGNLGLPLDCNFDTSASSTGICDLPTPPSSYEGYQKWLISSGSTGNNPGRDATSLSGTGNYYSAQPAANRQHRAVVSTKEFYTTSRCVNVVFYYYASGECFKQLNVFLLGSTKPIWSTRQGSESKWNKVILRDIKIYKPSHLVFEKYSHAIENCEDISVAIDGLYVDKCDCTRSISRECGDNCANLGLPVKFDEFNCPLCPKCGHAVCANPFDLHGYNVDIEIDHNSKCTWNSSQIGEGELACKCKDGYINSPHSNDLYESECILNQFSRKAEWTPHIRFSCRDESLAYYTARENACTDPVSWLDSSIYSYEPVQYPIQLGIVLSVQCRNGLMPAEISALTTECTESGWTQTPSCIRPSCGLPVEVDFARLTHPLAAREHSSGAHVDYTCELGYEPDGIMEASCDEFGIWDLNSDQPPACKAVTCEPLVVPKGTTCQYSTSDNYTYYDEVSCSCDEGYRISSNNTIIVVCLASKKWTKPNYCEAIQCGPPVLASASFSCSDQPSLSYNSTLQCTCNSGYKTTDETNVITSVCNSNGMWSSIQACKPMVCPEPMFEISALYCKKSGVYNYGVVLPCICEVGYTPFLNNQVVVSAEMRCREDGSWSPLPECRQVTCRDIRLSGITNAVLRNEFPSEVLEFTFTYGDVLNYRCANDQRVFMVVCTERGVWSNGLNCSSPENSYTYVIDEIGALQGRSTTVYSSTRFLLAAVVILSLS